MGEAEPPFAWRQLLCHLLMSEAMDITALDCGMDGLTRVHDESEDCWHGPIFLLLHQPKNAGATPLNRDMGWLIGSDEESIETTDPVLGGRNNCDINSDSRPRSGWQGPIFLLTHLPKNDKPSGPADGMSK